MPISGRPLRHTRAPAVSRNRKLLVPRAATRRRQPRPVTETTVIRRQPTTVTVSLSHDDAQRPAAASLGDRLCALLADRPTTVVVDLSSLRGLSSEVVAALLSVRREATAQGSHVVLRASTSHSMSLLRRSRLVSTFEITTASGPAWRHG